MIDLALMLQLISDLRSDKEVPDDGKVALLAQWKCKLQHALETSRVLTSDELKDVNTAIVKIDELTEELS